ncbi:DUF2812 domain-containing protein [Mesobacillus jeotgali]|uniref:DUF2812 domain-containing protein n=1 Tax=Mesobacillus jeotgali TaxID=129985 RepID=UPI0009A7B74A|nr:DUF2812 domain-containing protein [Mesobacillus jeotgali]
MSKTVYKLRPRDFWRIGEHESWFADMAAQGLHLKKVGIHFAKFVKGEPQSMRYRIDVSNKKKIPAEQVEIYAENGWDYVTSYTYFHVFSSPVEMNAPELHTDPAEQSYTLKELDGKLARNAVLVIISMIMIIGMLSSIWFLDGTPTLMMIEGSAIQQTITAVFLGYTAYHSLQAALSIRQLRKNLVEGNSIDHHAPWKKHHRIHTAVAYLFTVVVGMSAIIPLTQLVKMDTKTLPEGRLNVPIVRLNDVEKNPDLVRPEPSYMSDDVDWGNRYTFNWSPLAPVQYVSDETGMVPGKLWGDGSGEYSPAIRTHYYELLIPAMADELVSDLIKRYSYETSQDEYIEKKHPDLDRLIVHVEKDKNEVFAAKGGTVMYVSYHGDSNITSLVENVAKKIRE